MLWKCCTQYASKFGRLRSDTGLTGKGQFSFQSQRKAIPNNAQLHTIALISHASKVMLKILQASLRQYVNCKLPDVQVGFVKSKWRQRSNCQHPLDHWKSNRVSGKHLLLLYWLCQSFRWYGSPQTKQNYSRDGNTRPADLPPEKCVYRSGSNS